MESFRLTRKEMASLLLSLSKNSEQTPLEVLQEAYYKNHLRAGKYEQESASLIDTVLPPIVEKLIKKTIRTGFSLSDIASLGQLIEYSHLTMSTVQNWVKRDFKPYFDRHQGGRKFSQDQAAIIFIVDDLKSSLDFDSIRKLFELLFDSKGDEHLIKPTALYNAYTTMFEELDANNDQLIDMSEHLQGHEQVHQDMLTEEVLRSAATDCARAFTQLAPNQREAVRNILLVAAISIQTSYFHSLARQYCNATLFLHVKR